MQLDAVWHGAVLWRVKGAEQTVFRSEQCLSPAAQHSHQPEEHVHVQATVTELLSRAVPHQDHYCLFMLFILFIVWLCSIYLSDVMQHFNNNKKITFSSHFYQVTYYVEATQILLSQAENEPNTRAQCDWLCFVPSQSTQVTILLRHAS